MVESRSRSILIHFRRLYKESLFSSFGANRSDWKYFLVPGKNSVVFLSFGFFMKGSLTDLSDLTEIKCNFKNFDNQNVTGKDYLRL